MDKIEYWNLPAFELAHPNASDSPSYREWEEWTRSNFLGSEDWAAYDDDLERWERLAKEARV
jgi:hypothetical protein